MKSKNVVKWEAIKIKNCIKPCIYIDLELDVLDKLMRDECLISIKNTNSNYDDRTYFCSYYFSNEFYFQEFCSDDSKFIVLILDYCASKKRSVVWEGYPCFNGEVVLI